MEKLQQAIERARQERQGSIGKVPSFEDCESIPLLQVNSASSATDRFRFTGPPPNPIRYTQTRVVQLDDARIEQNRVIAGRIVDRRVEAYHQLRTQVLQTLAVNNWSTLAITSPMNNAGKTLTSVNLAISLAKEVNHSVLLVDVDISEPDVHETLGVNIKHGLIDVLEGRAQMQQALFNPGVQRLTVLPCRPAPEYSSEILTSPEMVATLNEIRMRYESRIVIFDLPPLLRNDEALKFTPFVDATLMVVEAGKTSPDEIERASHLMKGANLIGTILNKAQ